MWLLYYSKPSLRLDRLHFYRLLNNTDCHQALTTWWRFHGILLSPEDWACSLSVQTCTDPLVYNTLASVSIFLCTYSYFAPQQNLLGLHSKCLTILRSLLKIQKVLLVQTADTVVPAVKISKTSTTFLSILFLLPYKKETQSKNGPCYRKRQDVPSAIKHERNWVHLKVLSSRYLLRNNSNKSSKISSNKWEFSNMEHLYIFQL